VPAARRWVMGLLGRWELDEPANDVALLASELVTNGVVHARSRLIVTVAVADGLLEIGVSDDDPRAPRFATQTGNRGQRSEASSTGADLAWLATGGRGLGLVDSFAGEWGIANLATGKQVWFRFPVAQSWPPRSACPCRRTDLARTRLDSGRYAVGVPGPWDEAGP
jgi:anti-sigma regulatory factor (Ser/Thr protein kinase)